MGLRTYKAKRDFRRTPEPGATASATAKRKREPRFVVQKHAARRLHYDFRLEMDGVLKSWAVPKGFPSRRGEKRLAIHVEDHPIHYAEFEGTIPKGNYGAGTVMVWDQGTYTVSDEDPAKSLAKGKLRMTLHGQKLKGDWTLVRMHGKESEEKEPWLFLKSGADVKSISKKRDDESVLTKRSMKQIETGRSASWHSERPATHGRGSPAKKLARLDSLPSSKASFVSPMKARLKQEIPSGSQWLYELKLDGYRAIAVKRDKNLELFSRAERPLTRDYPEITSALKELSPSVVVLDGEIVAVDEEGRSSFQLLQGRSSGSKRPPILYYVFDVLNLENRDLKGLPLEERKRIAEEILKNATDPVRLSASIDADANALIAEVKRRGLEGVIAKERHSKYEPGLRSGSWVKVKTTNEQEFVIGGYTQPKGTRHHFGALLVGYYKGKKLMFAAKVGTGFDSKLLKSLHDRFQSLRRSECPFANLPASRARRFGQALTASQMKLCVWLQPKLVCQVRFSEWTRDGGLRQPVFLGLRTDKKPHEVVRE